MLLPAPFSPTRPHTSPARDREIDAVERNGRAESLLDAAHLEPRRRSASPDWHAQAHLSMQIWLHQLLDLGPIEHLACHEVHAGVDAAVDLFATKVLHHRHHAQVAHPHRILHDERLDRAVAKPRDQTVGRIEADELDLARPAVVLQHAHHGEALDSFGAKMPSTPSVPSAALVLRQQRFGPLVGAFDIGADMLIAAQDLRCPGAVARPRRNHLRGAWCCRGLRRSAAGSRLPLPPSTSPDARRRARRLCRCRWRRS